MTTPFIVLAMLAAAPEQQKVSNQLPFDIGTCKAPKPTLPTPLNAEAVVGALRLLRPAILECLFDPKARTGEGTTVTVKGKTVAGAALADSGKVCVEKAVAGLGLPDAPPAGEIEVKPPMPPVKFGMNSASDIAATIRLAQPQWCDCYKGGGQVNLSLRVKSGGATEAKADDDVGKCLAGKVQALKFNPPTEVMLPYAFLLVDSSAEQDPAGAAPDIAFLQLDAIRARRSAEAALAVGGRISAVTTYDGAVATYNKKKKPFAMLKELQAKCADMVKADEGLVAALEAQHKLDARTAELAGQLAAKDAQWKNTATAAQEQVKASEAEVVKAKAARDSDVKVCPK